MWKYIFKRLLWFIPALFSIAFLAFVISINAPGDPAERYLSAQSGDGDQQASAFNRKEEVRKLRIEWGLDLPLFYFSINTLADHPQLNSCDDAHFYALRSWMRQTGKTDELFAWYNSVVNAKFENDSSYTNQNQWLGLTDSLFNLKKWQVASAFFTEKMAQMQHKNHPCNELFKQINQQGSGSIKRWIPLIHWNGTANQFHYWLWGNGKTSKGIVRGDWGVSLRDAQPIGDRIGSRVKWSMGLSILAVVLCYLISIPIGIWAGYKKDSWFDRISSSVLFFLYTLPSFFVATGLLVLFANPDIFDWFPASGVRHPQVFDAEWPFYKRLAHYGPYLVLPIVAYTYNLLAFTARQTRNGIINIYSQPFILTARAKGLPEKTILWKHAFRNSLLPLITLLSALIPSAFAGSLVIEIIFGIPGMGLEIYEATLANDYPTIVAVFTLFGFLTLLFNLLADIAYSWADPRIRFFN